MPINTGFVEATLEDSTVVVRVYYDATQPVGPSQPLINGPRGYCLDVSNTSGKTVRVSITNGDTAINANVQQGNPVTSGAARSRTAAQLAGLGYATRGDVSALQIG